MFTPAQIVNIARRASLALPDSGTGHTVYTARQAAGRYIVGGLAPAAILPTGVHPSTYRAAIARMIERYDGNLPETLGFWEDNGAIYLDLGETYTLERYALQAARERGELAIYDRETGECITVEG